MAKTRKRTMEKMTSDCNKQDLDEMEVEDSVQTMQTDEEVPASVQIYYVTIKVDIKASKTFSSDLQEKYKLLFSIILDGDNSAVLKSLHSSVDKPDFLDPKDIQKKKTDGNK